MTSGNDAVFQDQELSQSKSGTKTVFQFFADELKYTVADKSSSSTFKTPYAELTRDHGFLVERNSWLLNVGLLWIAIGVLQTGLAYSKSQSLAPSMWLILGLGCAAWAWVRSVRYTKIPTGTGTILIIDDAQKPEILAALEARRVDQLRRWHDFIDASEDPQRQRTRLNWLHEEGALNDAELGERIGRVDNLLVQPLAAIESLIPGDRLAGTTLN